MREWIDDHVVKFAGWQHPATGREARFAVPETIVLSAAMPFL